MLGLSSVCLWAVKQEMKACRGWGVWDLRQCPVSARKCSSRAWFKSLTLGCYSWSLRSGQDFQGGSPCRKTKKGAKGGSLRNTSFWGQKKERSSEAEIGPQDKNVIAGFKESVGDKKVHSVLSDSLREQGEKNSCLRVLEIQEQCWFFSGWETVDFEG